MTEIVSHRNQTQPLIICPTRIEWSNTAFYSFEVSSRSEPGLFIKLHVRRKKPFADGGVIQTVQYRSASLVFAPHFLGKKRKRGGGKGEKKGSGRKEK